MTRLIILRHGETEWNLSGREMGQLDSPLTQQGIFQAQRLAERLSAVRFEALYSSDLGRAAQTAQIIATACGLAVVYDKRLRERNMGVFEGLTPSQRAERFPEERAEYRNQGARYVIPGGESADQCFERSLPCIDELATRHAGQTLVIVSHGGVLMGFFEAVFGLPFGSAQRYRRANCAWNLFVREDDRWTLETWGDVSHLAAQGRATQPKQSTEPSV